MTEKLDYLPVADHFNVWLMDNKDFIFDIFDEVHGEGNGNWKRNVLENRDVSISINFEVRAKNSNGFWDLKAVLSEGGKYLWDRKVLAEYKTSLEESNIENVVRQIKKRTRDLDDTVILTFDSRFERYRKVIENEGISLKVFQDSLRKKLKKNFGDSKSENNNLSQFA